MPLGDIADELYGLPADEFTKARGAAAKGAPDLADQIKAFKRPTASAWLVNQLARQRADRIEELLRLGDELRTAQDTLSGDDLRRLNRERHQLVHAVAEEARELGSKVTDAVARELEATLDAALADPEAGEAIRTGRLMRALASAGFESVDLTDAVAAPDAEPAPRPRPSTAPTKRARPKQATPKKASEPRADQAKARRELAKARTEAERLAKELAIQDERVGAARERVDAARAELERLDAEQKQARSERAAAEKDIEQAQRERNAVARRQRAAQQRLDKLGSR